MLNRVRDHERTAVDLTMDLPTETTAEIAAARRRLLVAWVLPTLVILAAACLPLILGQRTLYLRDVFGTHLEMKWFQAEAMRGGELPLVDPYRAGGQAHLGNPNTVALYPTNLLFLFGDVFWAFNAHFWIHLLLAPVSFYCLARAWRLAREAAWMGGVAYAASGYFLSNLNLYNLMAPVTLGPAFIAAAMTLAEGRRRALGFAATVGLWALLVLGGDPMTAAMALGLAGAAVALRVGRRWSGWGAVAAALGLGTLVALPQIVEFIRILPQTFRAFWGYSSEAATVASFSPAAALEWLLPLFYGWPNLGFWGRAAYGGEMPLLFSLAPGVLVLGLVLASGRPFRHVAWWSWGAVGLGLFLALGGNNPLFGLLLKIPGLSVIRLPVKFWLLVAIGGSLLAALGFERLSFGRPRAFGRALVALTAVYLGLWAFLALGGSASFGWARGRIPAAFGDPYVGQERLRWTGVALVSLLVLVAALGVLKLARRHPRLLAILPVLHLASQIFFLKPLIATDEIEPYVEPPALLQAVPEDATVVHGDKGGLFGQPALALDRYPDLRLIWFQRQTHAELYPWAGERFRRHYELDPSPEGLDAFLTRATAQALTILPDPARVRLLAASGVDRLIVSRRLRLLEAADQVELVHTGESVAGDVHVYRIPNRVAKARVVPTILRSPHLNGTLDVLTAPDFDARLATVLPGANTTSNTATDRGVAKSTPADRPTPVDGVVWLDDRAESMELEVTTDTGGALVIQRTPLPIFRAEVDGEAAPIQPADLHRMGIEIGPGEHRVRIWVNRTPLAISVAIAALALGATGAVTWRLRKLES